MGPFSDMNQEIMRTIRIVTSITFESRDIEKASYQTQGEKDFDSRE